MFSKKVQSKHYGGYTPIEQDPSLKMRWHEKASLWAIGFLYVTLLANETFFSQDVEASTAIIVPAATALKTEKSVIGSDFKKALSNKGEERQAICSEMQRVMEEVLPANQGIEINLEECSNSIKLLPK